MVRQAHHERSEFQAMKVFYRIPSRWVGLKAPVAAIGIFDGVHLGHQAILKKALQRSRALPGTPMAVTFYPHPLSVLAPQLLPPLIVSLEARLAAFKALGMRAALVIPFTRSFSLVSPEVFVREVLVKVLRVKEVVVGHDFGFGAGRSGTIQTLREMGRRYGFHIHVVKPVKVSGRRVSSRLIRDAIRAGKLELAQKWLSRPVTVEGKVIHGQNRGKKLGFPTANIQMEAGVLPPVGVYAVWVRHGGKLYDGMANVGYRPTFGISTTPLLEVHLFGVKRPLYGKRLEVAFVRRLRLEKRFPSAAALAKQLARDARHARQLLENAKLKQVFALQPPQRHGKIPLHVRK